jgi:hypothetical protein
VTPFILFARTRDDDDDDERTRVVELEPRRGV